MNESITPCAKCGHERLYVVSPLEVRNYEYRNSTHPLALVLGDDEDGDVGSLELRACAACGFAELYARDLEVLARASRTTRKVRLVSAEGRYR